MQQLKIAVLGGGSWGTTVAALVARNTEVTLWARDPATVEEINHDHCNSKYLPWCLIRVGVINCNER